MSIRKHITAGIAATAVLFGLTACDDRTSSPSAPAEEAQHRPTQITTGNLIAALNNVNVQIDRLNALNDLTVNDVQVVNVEDVLNNANILNNSRFLNQIAILQDFLNNSLNDVNVQILNNALNNLDLALNDVVAINVLSGGDVIVFAQ